MAQSVPRVTPPPPTFLSFSPDTIAIAPQWGQPICTQSPRPSVGDETGLKWLQIEPNEGAAHRKVCKCPTYGTRTKHNFLTNKLLPPLQLGNKRLKLPKWCKISDLCNHSLCSKGFPHALFILISFWYKCSTKLHNKNPGPLYRLWLWRDEFYLQMWFFQSVWVCERWGGGY